MGLYDGIKDVASIIQKAGDIELYARIIDLQKQALDLVEENTKLKTEINGLKEQKDIGNSLIYENEVYYLKRGEQEKDGPYCTRCWDTERILVRTHEDDNCMGTIYNTCPKCGTKAFNRSYEESYLR